MSPYMFDIPNYRKQAYIKYWSPMYLVSLNLVNKCILAKGLPKCLDSLIISNNRRQ